MIQTNTTNRQIRHTAYNCSPRFIENRANLMYLIKAKKDGDYSLSSVLRITLEQISREGNDVGSRVASDIVRVFDNPGDFNPTEKQIIAMAISATNSGRFVQRPPHGNRYYMIMEHNEQEHKIGFEKKNELAPSSVEDNTEIHNPCLSDPDGIQIGELVRFVFTETGEYRCMRIICDGDSELNKSLSINSPIGHALLGHKPGDTIKVRTPKGICEIKVLNKNE